MKSRASAARARTLALAGLAGLAGGCTQIIGISPPIEQQDAPMPDAAFDATGDATSDAAADASVACAAPLAFGAPTSVPAGSNRWFEVGDLDHDGVPDLVLAGRAAPALAIWHGPGPTLANELDLALPSGCTAATTARIVDLDGDGFNDLVVTACAKVLYYRQLALAPGTFATPVALPANSAVADGGGIAFADFDHDGVVDVASDDRLQVGIALQRALQRGTFVAGPAIAMRDTSLLAVTSFAAGDFSGDGRDDVAYLQQGALVVAPQLGSGSGSDATTAFGSAAAIGSATPSAFASADFDGDGRPDFALVGATPELLVQHATPAGSFTSVALAGAGLTATGATGVFTDDADGDGRPDIEADGQLVRQCPAPAVAASAFVPAQPVGEGAMVRFAHLLTPVGAGAPDLIYYSPSAQIVVIAPQQ